MDPARAAAVRKALTTDNHWEEANEWRIFTVMTSRIERRVENNRWMFRVTVECDHEFSAACPTVERALEVVVVYEQLIKDLFSSLGWPGWASKDVP